MSLLTVSDLIDEVRDEIPGKEQAVIERAANKVITRVHHELVQPTRSTFTTRVKTTTGTVSATQNSTAVTFSSGVLSASDPIMLVQIEGDSTWYMLTRNGADDTGALSSAWAEATDATATYTIVYPTVSFDGAVGQIISIKRYGYEELVFDHAPNFPSVVGTPERWSPYAHDASGSPDDKTRIILSPAPDDYATYEFWYVPRTTLLTPGGSTSATLPFPNLWYDAVVHGVLFYCWKQEDEGEKAMLEYDLFERALAKARGAALPGAVVPPRGTSGGLYAYEDRPIGGS